MYQQTRGRCFSRSRPPAGLRDGHDPFHIGGHDRREKRLPRSLKPDCLGEQMWAWHRGRLPPGSRRAQTQSNALWTAGWSAHQPWPAGQISSRTPMKWSAKPFRKTNNLKRRTTMSSFFNVVRNARTLNKRHTRLKLEGVLSWMRSISLYLVGGENELLLIKRWKVLQLAI